MADAARIIWFFQRQLGLITREQCFACGLTEGQITHRLRSGIWIEIRPGVYALGGVAPSWEQALLAVTLSTAGCWASHGSGAHLFGVRGFLEVPDAFEVVTSLGRLSRLDGVVGHRSGHLFDADLTHRGPIPTVTAARAIVDVSGRLTVKQLGSAVDEALRRRLLSLEGLRRCAERLGPASGPVDARHPTGPGGPTSRLLAWRQRSRDSTRFGRSSLLAYLLLVSSIG